MAMLQGNSKTFDNKWPKMQPIVLKLLGQEPVSKEEWQDLFYDVHTVCLWDEDKGVAQVHEALKNIISNFIKNAKMKVKMNDDNSALLKAYISVWTKFFEQCLYLPPAFSTLEKSLESSDNNLGMKKNESRNIIRKLMLDSWNEHVFCDIRHRLQDSAMILLKKEREGISFDSQLVIGVRQSYVNLSSDADDRLKIYREHFESAYIKATQDHYQSEAPAYLSENGVIKYMKYAHKKLREEEDRAERYLEATSVPILVKSVVSTLVEKFLMTILSECLPLIRQNNTEELNLMFSLVDRIPDAVTKILEVLESYIVDEGKINMHESREIITADSEKYIEKLLSLFERFSKLVKDSFNDDPRFLTTRDKAFEIVVNDRSVFELDLNTKTKSSATKIPPESRCPELLANYCDMLLRKTPMSKKLSSEEIETKLKDVLLVLKYVSNKDVFMKYHKAHLTRRLILGTSADNDKEESMVEWLREVGMPADYVNKLARMFQDIKVSDDINRKFKEQSSNGSDIANIKILNAGAWARRSDRISVSLPTELEDLIPDVEEFYKKNHHGRKLQWHHLMSNGIITFKTDCGQYDLEVTTFQLSVLFTWNQRPHEAITFENLRLATQLPESELRKTLWSLVVSPKTKRQVLLCNPEVSSPKDFNNSTLFSVNHQYALIKNGKVQKRGRINLIGRLQLSTERTREEDNEGIIQLRILRTQEAIVKILKMRKRINHAQLQTELVEMLKNMFFPQKKLIKQQIEWLIEHKYMKRDEEDINVFIYLV
ncbi:cullin-5-like [Styela clava]|uniref:cullin-5-like n=1 Tax=Styela clava TaxID=7725 RepID=UPI00193A560E|nr:cullin-5-like [Styela clava]